MDNDLQFRGIQFFSFYFYNFIPDERKQIQLPKACILKYSIIERF